jgi:hypothetical protein
MACASINLLEVSRVDIADVKDCTSPTPGSPSDDSGTGTDDVAGQIGV